jgi:thiosulfate reductase cytochrome b subunit
MIDRARIHPLVVRMTHWINAVGIVVMILSGWAIYNAHPIFPFRFPREITLGGGFIGAMRLHFAAMWLVMGNALLMIGYGLLSGRYVRKLFPLRPRDLWRDVAAALAGKLGHSDFARYNAVQKLLYTAVLLGIVGAIVTGLAIWKPVQFQAVTLLLGDFDAARVLHFLAMAGITLFLLIHVSMALVVPRSILTMLRGW